MLYKWRAKFGGMDASVLSQMKAMESLKRIYADLNMQNEPLKQALGKKLDRPSWWQSKPLHI